MTTVDVTPAGDGGVLKEVLRPGPEDGSTPGAGCKVSVHYTGTLLDGTVFDSSRDRGQPFEFNLGKGQVIKAWDLGVATMKKGELAKLICRSEYAYGKSGSPPKIPPDATLCFEVEMIGWLMEDLSAKKDGGILREIVEPGEGHATPNDGSVVNVSLQCHLNGRLVDDRDLSFALSEGSEINVPPGVEKALEKFKIGEKSRLEVKAKYGWGDKGCPALNVPPNADLVYTIKLKEFEKCKESWELDSTEKLRQGKLFKEKGTNYFKENKLQLALKMYKKAIEYVDFDGGFVNEGEQERKAVLVAVHLNSALCLLKAGGRATEAREQCDKALALDPANEKGLFRRGQANLSLGEPETARLDFEAVVRHDPANKAAAQQVAACDRTLKEQKANEKQIYANMFDKFARQDTEAKDSRFGWWDGKAVKVEKMEEPFEEEEEEERRKQKIKEYKVFIEQAKERRKMLEEELKSKNINTEEDVLEEPLYNEASEQLTLQSLKEEEERKKQPDVMKTLGEWGSDEREREPTEFEKENPNILMLDGTGDFKNM